MKGNFRSLLREFCLDGSILGLKYFYLYPDKASRCFWAVFMLANIATACMLTYLLYGRFEAMPTRITIENHFEPIAGLPFPAITVCSPNQMTVGALQHFERTFVNGNRSIDLESALPQVLGFYHFTKFDPATLEHLQSLIELNRYTVPEVLNLMTQSCEQFLVACFFKKRRYPHCRGLFHPVLTKHGLCCIFNSPYYYKTNRKNERHESMAPHVVEKTGLEGRLTVVTDFQPQDAVDSTVHFAGATRVMFTDWNEFPADDETLLVPPNTEAFHFLRATATYCSSDVQELPPSSRKCLFEDERELPFFRKYRNSDCDLLCLIRAVEARCGCLLFYLPRLLATRVCDLTTIKCIIDTRLNLNDWMGEDRCECPRDCDVRHYTVDITVGNLDALPYTYTGYYKGYQFNKSTSILHFAFPGSTYEKQKQETIVSYTTLVSNLGGVFGLCMGCSVISVLEIFFYKYIATKNYVNRRLRRNRRVGRFYYE